MTSPPFKVKAVYEYVSEHADDLQFPIGQIITVTELEGDDWYVGEYSDVTGVKKEGLFPTNFVEKYEPEVPSRPSRPSRPKQEVQAPAQAPAPTPAVVQPVQDEMNDDFVPSTASQQGDNATTSRNPRASTAEASQQARGVPPPAPVLARGEPVEASTASAAATTSAKKAPPPVAAKSNAFKDRIAAFNQPAAAPLAPVQIGRKPQAADFIKKPFVAPPPSKNAYIPPPRVEPVHKPYLREEDPEIKQRQEEDRAAAEAAGLTNENSTTTREADDEDAPKPMTLKERMALLQQQQQEQAQRRAEAVYKRKPPVRSPELGAAGDGEDFDVDHAQEERDQRQSSDIPRARPIVPLPERESIPQVPETEIVSDGHEADQSGAGELTEDDSGTLGPDDSEEASPVAHRHQIPVSAEGDLADEDETTERDVRDDEEQEEDEDDSMDEEERRKQELRARMARLGGAQPGMGVMLGFGAPPPATLPRKKPSKIASEETEQQDPELQRVPMVPIPGLPRMQNPKVDVSKGQHDEENDGEVEEAPAVPRPPKRSSTTERAVPPPVPKESRPMPPPPAQEASAAPPVPLATRPLPPPPEARPAPPPPRVSQIMSPGLGSESDDEMSAHAKDSSADLSGGETPIPGGARAPPVPGSRDVPPRPGQSPDEQRTSYFGGSGDQTTTAQEKRMSRPPPPVPGAPPPSSRPAPPPPPGAAPRRSSTLDTQSTRDEDERVSSEYDGDYDTDIASGAKHRDALKAPHVREPSLTDDPNSSFGSPVTTPVPLLQQTAHRAVPPPPPPGGLRSRPSMDRPPPPVPPTRDVGEEAEYDPYRYPSQPPARSNTTPFTAPPLPSGRPTHGEVDESSADEPHRGLGRSSTDRAPPPPPPDAVLSPPLPASAPRQSLDVNRSGTVIRRSMEGRPSGEQGQIATDIDLTPGKVWWTDAQPLPPVFQSRNGIDLLSECEETSKSKRGGHKEITKDIYILFMDYSQTVISVRYDSQEPEEAQLEQRHEAKPANLRQDQLEAAWQRFGRNIAASASALGNTKKDSTVADGSPYSLPLALIKGQPQALLPVGTRGYGALVYANLANASTVQLDEIRPGDIITVRNARFEGHHGAMKSKYKADYGLSHVAIVEEWDGTKRAVRAWEQGRDKKGGVRSEKFRLSDLRSGEVKIWRVVGRDWVGWDS